MKPEEANEELFLNVFVTTVAAMIPLLMVLPCKMEDCGNHPRNIACISIVILIITSLLSKRWAIKKLDLTFWIVDVLSITGCYLIYGSSIEYHLRGMTVFGICAFSFVLLFLTKTMKVIKEANEFIKDFNEKNN